MNQSKPNECTCHCHCTPKHSDFAMPVGECQHCALPSSPLEEKILEAVTMGCLVVDDSWSAQEKARTITEEVMPVISEVIAESFRAGKVSLFNEIYVKSEVDDKELVGLDEENKLLYKGVKLVKTLNNIRDSLSKKQ